MALQLNIHEVPHYYVEQEKNGVDENGKDLFKNVYHDSKTVTLMTDRVTKELYFTLNDGETQDKAHRYVLGLVYFDFQKKMYQPTEITATIQIRPFETRTSQEPWYRLSMERIVELFKNKKVSVYDMDGFTTGTTIADNKKVGEDFYVQEVVPKYLKTSMNLVLKIYSLDKLMTLEKTSRSFVAKKLGAQIMADNLKTYKKPYDSNDTKGVEFDTSNMKVLAFKQDVKAKTEKSTDDDPKFEQKNIKTEHIFPLLVQYNESFYDMLARTCNRWGEFMYYESGKLNVGYPKKEKKDIIAITHDNVNDDKFNTIQYINLDEKVGENNDRVAKYDESLLSMTQNKNPNKVEGILLSPGKKWEKPLMKTITSFLKNDKNLPTYLGNLAFDSLYDLAVKNIDVDYQNEKHNGKYFLKKDMVKDPERFSLNQEIHSLFSELVDDYKSPKYLKILAQEDAASKNAVYIDFDTNYPCLKLGDIIDVYGENYIVVQVNGGPKDQLKVKDDLWVIPYNENSPYVYQVIATPIQKDDKGKAVKDGQYYPTILPTGHVRYAEPQLASVTDAEDPDGEGRVRVKYDWQGKDDEASPWLRFTANAGGQNGLMGKHYKDDVVFVGYIDGNIERPYVLGALSKGASKDIHCESPGGHTLTVYDDKNGIEGFLTSAFLPGFSTLTDFLPSVLEKNPFKDSKNNLALAGGFELTDKYGLYKISGSTDQRNVSVSSPWGNVKIDAFTGITISAPNGDVKISGKNVSIEAGNNLKLVSGKNVGDRFFAKEKETNAGTAAQFATDIAVAVTKKLSEKLTNIVDLSIVRSITEILFRPVEGALTVKSNRFLKLEAGKNNCKYPVAAYNETKKKELLDAENKSDILAGVGSARKYDLFGKLTNLSLDNGMVTLISAVKPASEALAAEFSARLNACISAKKTFLRSIRDLKKWADQDGDVCKKYTDLQNDFWKEEDKNTAWDETKFEFKDIVKVLKPSELDDSTKLKNTISDDALKRCNNNVLPNSSRKRKAKRKEIVQKRIDLRRQVVMSANNLRTAIYNLQSIPKYKKKDVLKYFSWYWQTMPKNFKEELINAMSKDSCKDSIIYTFPDDKKDLRFADAAGFLSEDNLKKYTRRLVAYNLLKNLGFSKESRQQVGGADVPEPDCSSMNPSAANSLLNDNYWTTKYVPSLSGVPPIDKSDKTLGGEIRAAATSSFDDFKSTLKGIINAHAEMASWGEGKNGRILFGTDGTTYEMKDNTFSKVQGIKPNITFLKESDVSADGHRAKKLASFVAELRKALLKDHF